MPLDEAIRRAEEAGLDLIEVAASASPPVCRIADLGKFRFEQDKRARDAKKNQHVSEVKEVRLRPRSDEHDLQVRGLTADNVNRFREQLMRSGCRFDWRHELSTMASQSLIGNRWRPSTFRRP